MGKTVKIKGVTLWFSVLMHFGVCVRYGQCSLASLVRCSLHSLGLKKQKSSVWFHEFLFRIRVCEIQLLRLEMATLQKVHFFISSYLLFHLTEHDRLFS